MTATSSGARGTSAAFGVDKPGPLADQKLGGFAKGLLDELGCNTCGSRASHSEPYRQILQSVYMIGAMHRRFKSMLTSLARLYKVPATGFATALMLAGLYFGSNRDFGPFLFSIIAMPLLFVVALGATIWAASIEGQGRRALAAMALICITPIVYFAAGRLRDSARFLVWAPAHAAQLSAAMSKDRILMLWDDWGMAGTDNFSYLAVDTQDRLDNATRADQWAKALGQTCKVAKAERMWPKLYIVTTYTDCPFDRAQSGG